MYYSVHMCCMLVLGGDHGWVMISRLYKGCQPVSSLSELACSTGMDAGQAQASYRS